MEMLIKEEKVVLETKVDFNKRFSNWLIKEGFEREEDKTSNVHPIVYRHRELPIKVYPNKNEGVWFGDYEITFIETIYASANGKAQLTPIRRGEAKDSGELLNNVVQNMEKALELAQKIVNKVGKGE